MKVFIFLLFLFILPIIHSQKNDQKNTEIFDSKHFSKYLWSTYKPNLYFGMKNKKMNSVNMGLMWYGADKSDHDKFGEIKERIRHNCRMEDRLKYRWEYHNGKNFGRQIIEDEDYNMTMSTTFIKTKYDEKAQSWVASIKGNYNGKNQEIERAITLILYVNLEGYKEGSHSVNSLEYDDSNRIIYGFENDKKSFSFSINFQEGKALKESYQNYKKPFYQTWKVKDLFANEINKDEQKLLYQTTQDYPKFAKINSIDSPNIVAVQLTFALPFEVNIGFTTTELVEGFFTDPSQTFTNFADIKDTFERHESKKILNFHRKFDTIFPIKHESDFESERMNLREMAIQALSNVLGGIGYFYGQVKIKTEGLESEGKGYKGFNEALASKGLLTGTPSRSFFARGFLWDEGFHNIIISKWNKDLSIEIIDSWLSTIAESGWIPREQIRGPEAESQVPTRFILQNTKIANPPTLLFAIQSFVEEYNLFKDDNSEASKSKIARINLFLKKITDKITRWFNWYQNNQKISANSNTYQWFGRDSQHNLASGLDDFPRGMTPNKEERHLDLHVWMLEFVKFLRNSGEIFNNELVEQYDKLFENLKKSLFKDLYDKERNILNDYLGPQFNLIYSSKFSKMVPPYLWRGDNKCGDQNPNPLGEPSDCNPYSDIPCCSEYGWCGNSQGHCDCPKCKRAKKLEDKSDFRKEKIFNPHFGYVQLFPLAFGHLDSKEEIFKSTLKYLQSKNELQSEFGIRSLSKSDLLYHTGDDYWRGNIWMNINYLTLRGLYKFYRNHSEAKGVYETLRNKIIKTIFNEWKSTKTFYEQYSDIDGKGIRAHPFNGWTSLILNIITEKYH